MPDMRTPGTGPGVGPGRAPVGASGYFADFSEVRRQRVHTSDFVSLPFASRVVKGCRFGW